MKTKVIIICELVGMWNAYDFNKDELLSISKEKGDAVDNALALQEQGYRILVVDDEQEREYVKHLLGDNKRKKEIAQKKMQATLRGIFEQAHLKKVNRKYEKHN